jgi:hypothetical protein
MLSVRHPRDAIMTKQEQQLPNLHGLLPLWVHGKLRVRSEEILRGRFHSRRPTLMNRCPEGTSFCIASTRTCRMEMSKGVEIIGFNEQSKSYPMYSFDSLGNASLMQARVTAIADKASCRLWLPPP